MRITVSLALAGLLLMTSCTGSSCGSPPACPPPASGRVLAVCDGAVVISRGSKDGVRPGDTLAVTRDDQVVTTIVIHEVKNTQAVGTAIGGSASGRVVPGDKVIGDE